VAGGTVGALFRGVVFYGLLLREGMVWEMPRDAKAISLYYAVFCIDSILHPLDAIDHWT